MKSVCGGIGIFCLLLSVSGAAFAQSRDRDKEKDRDRKDDPSEQELAKRLTKAEESLLNEYLEVATEYYKQGEKESAVTVLEKVAHLDPKREGIKQRIDAINEEMLQENGLKTDIDVSKSWSPVCEVEGGKPFRITAVGEYKMDFATMIPLTGLSTADPAQDHVAVAPFGALIGVVLTDGKPGEPFAVNGGIEHTPKKGGQLYLRVNVPAAAKCKGEIKLHVSGSIKPLTKKR